MDRDKNLHLTQLKLGSKPIFTARHPKDDGRLYFQSVHISGGGGRFPGLRFFGKGVPGLRFFQGGSQVSDFSGGVPRSQIFLGEGVPGLRFFWGGSQVSDFPGGVPVSVKGKIFDTRFGLIHVQTGKKKFSQGSPPPQ